MPVHVMALLRRRPDMSIPDFLDYWQNQHLVETGATKLEKLPYFWYRQNHVLIDHPATQLATSPYDGWAEFYLEDLERWHAMITSPRVAASEADEVRFLAAAPQWFAAEDLLLRDSGSPRECIKLLRLFRRRFDLRVPQFRTHWAETYGPALLAEIPTIVRYVQASLVPSAYFDAQPRWDGADIIWLDIGTKIDASLGDRLGRGIGAFVDEDPPSIVAREVLPEFIRAIVEASEPADIAT